MNMKLGGCLIGYGLKKKNGEFTKVIFDKPIHNTITKHCLNNLCLYNGISNKIGPAYNNSYGYKEWASLFVKGKNLNGSSSRYGVFNFCGLGNGTGTTSVDDVNLKNNVGIITDTKKTGQNWCGWNFDNTNAIIKNRVSHIHTITENFTITEIGWFNKIYPDGAFELSSRVELNEPVNVNAGDEFYTIYEIAVQFQFKNIIKNSLFGCDLLQTNGIFYCSFGNGQVFPFPCIDGNGQGVTNNRSGGITGTTNETPNDLRYRGFNFPIFQTPNKLFLFNNNYNKENSFIYNQTLDWTTPNFSENVLDYEIDSFHVDSEFTIAQTAGNFYAIGIYGTLWRFGTFDENDNFTPTPITISNALKITVRQSWSTDLLPPSA